MSARRREAVMAAELKLVRTDAEEALIADYSGRRDSLAGSSDITSARDLAIEGLKKRGLPNRRVEAWKYTDLRTLMSKAAPFADKPAAGASAISGPFDALALPTIHLVNGYLVGDLPALPAAMEAQSLDGALQAGNTLLNTLGGTSEVRGNAAYDLNTAFMRDGAVIQIGKDVDPETPLHIAFTTDSAVAVASAARILVIVADGAQATLVESHSGPAGIDYQANHVMDVVLGEGARLNHIRLDANGDKALALSTITATLAKGSHLGSLNVIDGAAAIRHQVFVAYQGENATCDIRGATMIDGTRHADTTLVVDHAVAHGSSRELFKTAVDGEGTGVFQGKIIVRPHAQKTDGRMMSACLLLSDNATMNNKPELEIFADDVQCAHGATCGALDDDLLFYLMARGLPRKEAEAILIESFLGEAIEEVAHDGLRDVLMGRVRSWLKRRG
jgi:Fe-S cluster assembly protein SufD